MYCQQSAARGAAHTTVTHWLRLPPLTVAEMSISVPLTSALHVCLLFGVRFFCLPSSELSLVRLALDLVDQVVQCVLFVQ